MTYSEKYEKTTSAIRSKGEEILPSGARLVLYGSRARGDYRDDSDWDILILIPGEGQLSFEKIGLYSYPMDLIGWDLGEVISTAVYTYKEWERRKYHPFHENVERDKVIILNKL